MDRGTLARPLNHEDRLDSDYMPNSSPLQPTHAPTCLPACPLQVLPQQIEPMDYALAFPPGSPDSLRSQFSRTLLRLQEDGTLQRLEVGGGLQGHGGMGAQPRAGLPCRRRPMHALRAGHRAQTLADPREGAVAIQTNCALKVRGVCICPHCYY